MKEELYITFHSEDDIRHFVDTCNEFDDAIDIRIQKTEDGNGCKVTFGNAPDED